MTLFPFTRPKIGLYITAETLCVAQVNNRLGHQSYGGYVEQILPSGAIRLSPVESNIMERDQIIHSLRAAIGHPKGPQSVALCLPDLCARTTVLELATLPKKVKEQQALVEWRLQQDLNLSKEKRRVSYQLLSSTSQGWTLGTLPTDQPIRLLATAIQENIIEAYEALCLEVGLVPMSINLASPAVFNMCRPIMDSTIKTTGERISFVPNTEFFVYLADWGFSIIAIRNREPIFIRIKPLRHMAQWPPSVSQSTSEDGSVPSEAPTTPINGPQDPIYSIPSEEGPTFDPQTATVITNELLGTLQYFFETYETPYLSDEVYPLFLIGSHTPDCALPLITELIQQEFAFEADQGQPRIKAFPLYPGNTNLNLKPLAGLPSWTSTALPAFAATN